MKKLKISDITVVTTSADKLAEINQILGTNHKVSKIDVPEIQSLDLDEVIIQKAKETYRKIKKPVLVEDVSLEIKSLNGLPGTFIKFFLRKLGTEKTVALIGNKKTDTKVTSAVAIYDGENLKVFKGIAYGTLIKKNKGTNGFGFDKVFVPEGYSKTYAQMPSSLKNKISHRALALVKLKKYLLENNQF